MEMAMIRGPSDRKQVNISNPSELRAWAQHFRVSARALVLAVLAVGSSPDEVADYLGV